MTGEGELTAEGVTDGPGEMREPWVEALSQATRMTATIAADATPTNDMRLMVTESNETRWWIDTAVSLSAQTDA
jgi:hypothetical protein